MRGVADAFVLGDVFIRIRVVVQRIIDAYKILKGYLLNGQVASCFRGFQ